MRKPEAAKPLNFYPKWPEPRPFIPVVRDAADVKRAQLTVTDFDGHLFALDPRHGKHGYIETLRQVAANVRLFLDERDFSYKEAEYHSGVNYNTIFYLCSGKRWPRGDTIAQLEIAFGIQFWPRPFDVRHGIDTYQEPVISSIAARAASRGVDVTKFGDKDRQADEGYEPIRDLVTYDEIVQIPL